MQVQRLEQSSMFCQKNIRDSHAEFKLKIRLRIIHQGNANNIERQKQRIKAISYSPLRDLCGDVVLLYPKQTLFGHLSVFSML